MNLAIRQNDDQAAALALLSQRKERYIRMVELFSKAVELDKINLSYLDALEAEFSKLGTYIGLNFDDYYGKTSHAGRSGIQGTGSQSQSDGSESDRDADESIATGTVSHSSGRSGLRSASRKSAAPSGQENFSLREYADLSLSKDERLNLNRQAVELLKSKQSGFTEAEKVQLAQYTGHGGLLSVDIGVLNQHYTRFSVVRFMWDALKRLGLSGGWVLEPGCGVGNFIGNKPDGFNVVGFDFDSVAAKIASVLYPNDDISLSDFKNFKFEDHQSYVVGAIGNPPFGNYSRFDRSDTFARIKPKIHDHFILKMLETVQPGGLVAVISSTGTMDKKDNTAREAMIEMAHFLGAFRLPNSTFKANASTEVTTDLMFFQKRKSSDTRHAADLAFLESEQLPNSDAWMNVYYQAYPTHVLGTLQPGSGQFSNQVAVTGDLPEAKLKQLLITLPFAAIEDVPNPIAQPDSLKSKSKISLPEEASSANSILFLLKQLIAAQKNLAGLEEKKKIRAMLKSAITAHFGKYGAFDKSKIIEQFFGGSPDYNQLRAVAQADKSGISFSQIVESDTIFTTDFRPKLSRDKLSEIVLYCRQTGLLTTPEAIQEVAKISAAELRKLDEKDQNAFFNPESNQYEIRPEYISGNLAVKIEAAKKAGLEKNVQELSKKLPARKSAKEIGFDIIDVNTFLPIEVAEKYIHYAVQGKLKGVRGNWTIDNPSRYLSQISSWGWKDDYAAILEHYMNNEDYPKERVASTATDQEKAKAYEDQSLNTNKMRRNIPKRFREWLLEIADEEIRQKAEDSWNETYNVTIEPDYTGETFSCSNMGKVWTNGKPFAPRLHQKKWVEKALLNGAGVNAHGVGAGKTLSAIMLAGVMKERNMARKPLFVVPAKVIEKWIREFKAAFPAANVLNLKMDKQSKEYFLSIVQQNDYDAVFITHDGFKALPVSPETLSDYLSLRLKKVEDDIAELSAKLGAVLAAQATSAATLPPNVKQPKFRDPAQKVLKDLFKLKLDMEQKISTALQGAKLESVYFDDLGVDALIIDEAHNFKNLWLSTTAQELQIGVGKSSDRAEEAYMKMHYINRHMNNRNVFLLTATPTNNTPLEAYIFLRAIAPKYIEDLKLGDVDAFIRQYARIENVQTSDMIQRAVDKTIVTGYKNLETLRMIFSKYVEFVDTTQFEDVKKILPEPDFNVLYLEPNERDSAVMHDLQVRVESIARRSPRQYPKANDPTKTIYDNYLSVAGSGSRAAVDTAFYIESTVIAPDKTAEKWLYKIEALTSVQDEDMIWLQWRRLVSDDVRQRIALQIHKPETQSLIQTLSNGTSSEKQRASLLTNLPKQLSNITGEKLYDEICVILEGSTFQGRGESGRLASAWLYDAGIYGVEFEAQQGRSGGNNYVIFNDKDVQVTSKIRQNPKTLWHGTKHSFDAFSTSHVGKGEGQHLYGWGLYFTEVRSIAEWYADSVSSRGVDISLDSGVIEPDSKAGIMCKMVVENYWRDYRDVTGKDGTLTENVKNGQLIFCDPLTTNSDRNFHRLIKNHLVTLGIPAGEIEIMNGGENETAEKKIKTQEAFNTGLVRVIIGNTSAMGEGMDLNVFCTDIHHLDVPWKPSELIQRNGRGVRQGNVNPKVRIHYYLLRKSMDAYRYTLLAKKANWIDELWNGKNPEMEAEDQDAGGMDYETIMMALLDDKDKTKALDLSRSLKRKVATYNNYEDDLKSTTAAISALEDLRDNYSRDSKSYNYNKIKAFPKFDSTTLTDLMAELGTDVSDQYGFSAPHGYQSPAEKFRLKLPDNNHYLTEFALGMNTTSDGKGKQVYVGMGRLFDRSIVVEDADRKNAAKKLFDFIQRFANSYEKIRAERVKKYDDYTSNLAVFKRRIEQTKAEAYEMALDIVGLLEDADEFAKQNPKAATYFDDTFMSVQRAFFMPKKSWLEKTVAQYRADGLLSESGKARQNPAGVPTLSFLGYAEKLHTSIKAYKGNDFMFCTAGGDTIYIVPKNRVSVASKKVNAPAAEKMHEQFKHYESDGKDYEIDLPDSDMIPAGTAEEIWYKSDKIIQSGDCKGSWNFYHHDFDAGKRPVFEWDDCLVIKRLDIDGRGILN